MEAGPGSSHRRSKIKKLLGTAVDSNCNMPAGGTFITIL